jgi:glycosyltransferase involved in cell wall biosynthesis
MSDRLRVGMLAPVARRVPPLHYGPWERVVSILTEGLVARGVDVTLFATADSRTRARLVAVAPRGYAEDRSIDAKLYQGLHIAAAFEQASTGAFDILHNHFDFLPLTYCRLVSTPVVTTVHGFSSERVLPVYQAYNSTTNLVAISASDRRADLDYAATIHHGIPLDEFTFSDSPGEYLLFFGRIHPDKGAQEAVEVARRTGRKLILAGIVQDAEYFRTAVEPLVGGYQIRFAGSVGPAQLDALLGGALVLLPPFLDIPSSSPVPHQRTVGSRRPAHATRGAPRVGHFPVVHGLAGLRQSGLDPGDRGNLQHQQWQRAGCSYRPTAVVAVDGGMQ